MSYDMARHQQQEQQREDDDAKYKGVRKRKWGKWVSEIRLPNSRERIWLGSYDAPEKAARAFDAAQFCLRGPTAKFNFPDNPPDIAGGMSLTPAEIQVAAARFANSETSRFSSPPSPARSSSVSGGTNTVQLDDSCFQQMLNSPSFDYNVPEYGIFPGFDDLSCHFLAPPLPDYVEDNNGDWFSYQESLWNF